MQQAESHREQGKGRRLDKTGAVRPVLLRASFLHSGKNTANRPARLVISARFRRLILHLRLRCL
jgi:hypothetical protein